MKKSIQKLWPHLWRYRRALFLGMGALIIKDLLQAIQPLIFGWGIDSLTRGFALSKVFWFAALLVGISLIKGVFQYWMRVILIGMSRDIEFDLRNDLFAHLITLSSDFYNRYRTGDIMSRATNDLNAVRMMLGPGVMYWTETMFTFLFAIAVMSWADWRLMLWALIPAPVVSAVVILFGRMIHTRFERIQKMFSDISSAVQENLAGVRVLRAYVQEEAELRRFDQLNQEYIKENVSLARASGMFMPLLQTLVGISFLIVLWVGGGRLLDHKISLGGFMMFYMYMGMLVWPMIALGWVVNLMQRGNASLARIYQMIEERPNIAAPPAPRPIARLRGEIELRNITLTHGSANTLKNISLQIPAGATVAIVGHTGSGKSSLVHLIPRLIDPTSGSVMVDGHDVREYDPEDLRRQIGFVPQETFLFSATLAGNIAFGAKQASEDEIRKAADLAGLSVDIAGFPQGFETMVGERGITLSGGQKQRTAIARAILRNPRILILDDALSSVDTITEEKILEGLRQIMQGRTTIIISHRVSTVRHADSIFVLERGEVVEEGSHSELIGQGGYYADLYQKQLLEEELEAI
jgi:ATP-binding cassette, subfamily B, multidrug efflux pump